MKHQAFSPHTTKCIASVFSELDYQALGSVYCDEGGEAFWKDRRKPCQRFGTHVAKALKERLSPKGHSLYVGAGVAEIPSLIMETLELGRKVFPHNLRVTEVEVLNSVCRKVGVTFLSQPAEIALGTFDHLWLVSVLNDPERFPELSALSYNRADPIHFDPIAFAKERQAMWETLSICMQKLNTPALVTTSIEEQPWIIHWCETQEVPFKLEIKTYPTALVGDPICFMWVGSDKMPARFIPPGKEKGSSSR